MKPPLSLSLPLRTGSLYPPLWDDSDVTHNHTIFPKSDLFLPLGFRAGVSLLPSPSPTLPSEINDPGSTPSPRRRGEALDRVGVSVLATVESLPRMLENIIGFGVAETTLVSLLRSFALGVNNHDRVAGFS